MERTKILDVMADLKLFGMKAAYDETLATALKRQHEPQRLVGDLMRAEISEKQARSIKDQITASKLPLAKDLDDFVFKDTPINEALVRDLAGGGFIVQQRNALFVGGTGTGKSHAVSPSREAAFALDGAGASSPPSISSTSSGRDARGTPGPHRRLSHPYGLRRPRRTRLPAVPQRRRPAYLPPAEPALRARLDHYHDEPQLRRMGDRVRRTELLMAPPFLIVWCAIVAVSYQFARS